MLREFAVERENIRRVCNILVGLPTNSLVMGTSRRESPHGTQIVQHLARARSYFFLNSF